MPRTNKGADCLVHSLYLAASRLSLAAISKKSGFARLHASSTDRRSLGRIAEISSSLRLVIALRSRSLTSANRKLPTTSGAVSAEIAARKSATVNSRQTTSLPETSITTVLPSDIAFSNKQKTRRSGFWLAGPCDLDCLRTTSPGSVRQGSAAVDTLVDPPHTVLRGLRTAPIGRVLLARLSRGGDCGRFRVGSTRHSQSTKPLKRGVMGNCCCRARPSRRQVFRIHHPGLYGGAWAAVLGKGDFSSSIHAPRDCGCMTIACANYTQQSDQYPHQVPSQSVLGGTLADQHCVRKPPPCRASSSPSARPIKYPPSAAPSPRHAW